MRLEMRKSGGPECERCGSTEMVKIMGNVDLARDITLMLENEWTKRESEIRAAYEKGYKHKTARVVSNLREAVPSVVEQPKPSSIRFLKRRWQERLEQDIQVAVNELLEQTRL